MSFDTIKAINKGVQDAKAAERAKKRGTKLGGGGGRSRSKTRFTRKEGRASLNRGGRGISINYQKSVKGGKGLKGVIDYALNPEKSPELIYSNCGQDAKSILRTMQKFALLRPDITQEHQVGHITLSLPPRVGKVESKLWTEMIDAARDKLGLDDSFACAAVRHEDRPHDHLHLLFCRVSVNGNVHDKANIGLRCVATEALLEKRFNLQMVPEDEFVSRGHISKGEIEKAIKLGGTLPPRLQIAAALKIAVQDRPTPQLFAERLSAAGVGLRGNVASTGKMNGFSFTYDGVAFSGSKISKKYGWKALSERIDYDETRDREFLAELDGGTGTASATLADAVASVNSINRQIEAIPSIPDAGAVAASSAPLADRAGQLPGETTTAANRSTDAPPAATRKPAPTAIAVAALAKPARLITPPDLRAERWVRSAQLLTEFRRGLKNKFAIADLDRLASEAGHESADIISAHSVALDKLPSEVAQDVLRNTPSQKMREYVEQEFATAKRRLEAQKLEKKDSSQAEATAFRPK
jgi:hypothetical protein